MRDKDDSPILYKPKKHIEIAYTNIDNNESKLEKNISDFDLNSEYFNINKDDTLDKNINENLLFSSVGSEEKDKFNYYNVKKANIINYMTMSKFNNDTYQRQKSNLKIKKNKTKIETAKGDIISISNSSVTSIFDFILSSVCSTFNKPFLILEEKIFLSCFCWTCVLEL